MLSAPIPNAAQSGLVVVIGDRSGDLTLFSEPISFLLSCVASKLDRSERYSQPECGVDLKSSRSFLKSSVTAL